MTFYVNIIKRRIRLLLIRILVWLLYNFLVEVILRFREFFLIELEFFFNHLGYFLFQFNSININNKLCKIKFIIILYY